MTDSILKNRTPLEMNQPESGSNDSLPTVFLEIQRGRTAFPYRPVLGNRFLIGSAGCCDLCLGGASIPQLHSILHLDGPNVVLEVIADSPPLKINGDNRQSFTLCDGDVIEIGRFQVVARISHTPETPQVDQTENTPLENIYEILEPADEPDIPEETNEDLEELSAEELVDLIEAQQQMVEEYEVRRQSGAEALLQTVQDRAEGLDDSSDIQPEESDNSEEELPAIPLVQERNVESPQEEEPLPEEIQLKVHSEVETVLEQLHAISEELDSRCERLSRREAGYAEAAAGLLDAQYKLATQLEMLVLQLSSLNSEDSESEREKPRRAVA